MVDLSVTMLIRIEMSILTTFCVFILSFDQADASLLLESKIQSDTAYQV